MSMRTDEASGPLGPLLDRTMRVFRPVVPKRWRPDAVVVPVVRLAGVIGMGTPLRQGLSLTGVARALDRAFSLRNVKAVALAINSPGGSAVQSHLIFRRVRALAEEKNVPVIAAVEDVAASGGYMIACAADDIVVDPSSIVGSIGVIGATFGLDRAIDKLGIERRVYTAGEHKASLDPFLPEDPADVARIRAIQHEIHTRFIDLVKTRRGARLTGPEEALFSGQYWAGATAVGFGLVDKLGDLRSYLRERFGKDVITPLVAPERTGLARRLFGGPATELRIDTAGLADQVLDAIESRAAFGRFGL